MIYDWPDTLVPKSAKIQAVRIQGSGAPSINGTQQLYSVRSWRWVLDYTFGVAGRERVEAFNAAMWAIDGNSTPIRIRLFNRFKTGSHPGVLGGWARTGGGDFSDGATFSDSSRFRVLSAEYPLADTVLRGATAITVRPDADIRPGSYVSINDCPFGVKGTEVVSGRKVVHIHPPAPRGFAAGEIVKTDATGIFRIRNAEQMAADLQDGLYADVGLTFVESIGTAL